MENIVIHFFLIWACVVVSYRTLIKFDNISGNMFWSFSPTSASQMLFSNSSISSKFRDEAGDHRTRNSWLSPLPSAETPHTTNQQKREMWTVWANMRNISYGGMQERNKSIVTTQASKYNIHICTSFLCSFGCNKSIKYKWFTVKSKVIKLK